MTNEASITSDARPPDTLFGSRRPSVALTRNPANGSSGMSANTSLPLQRGKGIGVERLAVTEQRDDQGKADSGFSRGHGHDEEGDDLPVQVTGETAEGDEGQVHGVQHDLDRQQDRDQVLAQEHADRADGKER